MHARTQNPHVDGAPLVLQAHKPFNMRRTCACCACVFSTMSRRPWLVIAGLLHRNSCMAQATAQTGWHVRARPCRSFHAPASVSLSLEEEVPLLASLSGMRLTAARPTAKPARCAQVWAGHENACGDGGAGTSRARAVRLSVCQESSYMIRSRCVWPLLVRFCHLSTNCVACRGLT